MTAIDVDRIAHRLEGVEADPERQRYSQGGVETERGQAKPVGERVDVFGGKVVVLEEPEQRQVADDRRNQRHLRAGRTPRRPVAPSTAG